ncbi:hypothetical protein MASR2M41_11480 [Flammeovirgaceae bacterium]
MLLPRPFTCGQSAPDNPHHQTGFDKSTDPEIGLNNRDPGTSNESGGRDVFGGSCNFNSSQSTARSATFK